MRDNHPKRRRIEARNLKAAKRNGDKILIICEGKKTEPNYFKEIKKEYRARTASITIKHSDYGTDPMSVVNYAYELAIQGGFEQVYAVFDRDSHTNYQSALQQAEKYKQELQNSKKKPIIFKAIFSVPCFEIWLLLHFRQIFEPIDRFDVDKQLQDFWQQHCSKKYNKSDNDVFKNTKNLLETAFANLKYINKKNDGIEPYTDIGKLIKLLQPIENK
jgi:hypothetical protein